MKKILSFLKNNKLLLSGFVFGIILCAIFLTLFFQFDEIRSKVSRSVFKAFAQETTSNTMTPFCTKMECGQESCGVVCCGPDPKTEFSCKIFDVNKGWYTP